MTQNTINQRRRDSIHEIRAKLVRDDGSEEHLTLERRETGIYVRQLGREPYQITAGQHLDDALDGLRWYYADQLWLATPARPMFVPAAEFTGP